MGKASAETPECIVLDFYQQINLSKVCVVLIAVVVPSGYAGSDDGEDERTGIAEGGWREEKAESKTQLNRDMEKENGERK